MQQPSRTKAYDQLQSLLADRILILDGAMGTMIQALGLSEEQVRGDRFHSHHKDVARFSDLLCLTRPDDVTGRKPARQFLEEQNHSSAGQRRQAARQAGSAGLGSRATAEARRHRVGPALAPVDRR